MRYLSVCSGIEAATVAWHELGWEPVAFCEIEKFPSQLLQYYYPWVPNLGDMTKLNVNEYYKSTTFDLLVGGTPCQSFSIAGLRGGLDTTNGNLALWFCRILLAKLPPWFVWENVPGVFSSFSVGKGSKVHPRKIRIRRWKETHITETSDFAAILNAFRECGYSVAYRVLDSQYFGVPQRRRRVFVVGHLGNDWRPPTAVLFERESLRRDFTPSREKGKAVAALTSTGVGTCGADDNQAQAGHIVVATLDANYGKLQGASGQDLNHGHSHLIAFGGNNTSGPIETATALNAKGGKSGRLDFESETFLVQPVQPIYFESRFVRNGRGAPDDIAAPLKAQSGATGKGDGAPLVAASNIRRLTPLECERLQGFPDNYTSIPGASDSARYKAIGNSMTTHVMRWIGERIQLVDKVIESLK